MKKPEWEIKFDRLFIRDDGLLAIGKYDEKVVKEFIRKVIKRAILLRSE